MKKKLLRFSLVFLVFFLSFRMPLSATRVQNLTNGGVEFVLDNRDPIDTSFESIGRYDQNGFAIVTVKETITYFTEEGEVNQIVHRFGMINQTGEIILEPIYGEISNFNEHYYLIAMHDDIVMYGLLSKVDGSIVLEAKYDFIPNLEHDRFFIGNEYLDDESELKKPIVFSIKNQKISVVEMPDKVKEISFEYIISEKLSDYVYRLSGLYLDSISGSMDEEKTLKQVNWYVNQYGESFNTPSNSMVGDYYSYAIGNKFFYVEQNQDTFLYTIYQGTVSASTYTYEVFLDNIDYLWLNRVSRRYDYRFYEEEVIHEYYFLSKETQLKPVTNPEDILLTEAIIKQKGFYEEDEYLYINYVAQWDVYIVSNTGLPLQTKAYVMDKDANLIIDEDFAEISFHEEMDWLHLRKMKSLGVEDPLGQDSVFPFDGYYDLVNKVYVEPQFTDLSLDDLSLNNFTRINRVVGVVGFAPVVEGDGGEIIIIRDDAFVPIFDIKVGMINREGKIVVEPIYDALSEINSDGYIKTERHVKMIYDDEYGSYLGTESRTYGLVHVERGLVVEPIYSAIQGVEVDYFMAPMFDINNQMVVIVYNDDYTTEHKGIITPDGVLFEPVYMDIKYSNENYILRVSDTVWEVIDSQTSEKQRFDFSDYDRPVLDIDYANGFIIVYSIDLERFVLAVGVVDVELNTKIDFEHEIIQYRDSLWYLEKYDENTRSFKQSILNSNFEVMVPYENDYDQLSDYVDGYAIGTSGEVPTIEVSNLFSRFFIRAHANVGFVLHVINENGNVLGDFSNEFQNILLLGDIDGESKALVVIDGQSYFATMIVTPMQNEEEPPTDPNEEDEEVTPPVEEEEEATNPIEKDDEETLPDTSDHSQTRHVWLLLLGVGILSFGKKKLINEKI